MSCRLLGVSRSGYYEWKERPISARDEDNNLLLKHIKQMHAESRNSYGSPRVHAELTLGLGMVVNEKRVARLMRQAGIRGEPLVGVAVAVTGTLLLLVVSQARRFMLATSRTVPARQAHRLGSRRRKDR